MEAPREVVLDSDVLITFIDVGLLDVLLRLPEHRFIVTQVVCREVSRPSQQAALRRAMAEAWLTQVEVPASSPHYAELRARLDDGESSAVAIALAKGAAVASNDTAVKKLAGLRFPELEVLDTVSLIVSMIRAGLLSVAEADAAKQAWQNKHRFTLKLDSFADCL